MFYGQCWKCGERWELGTASTCTCEESQAPVQVSPQEFVKAVLGKEQLTGKPAMWAQWPSREKT